MLVERLSGCVPAECLAWSAVERGGDRLELLGGVSGEVRALIRIDRNDYSIDPVLAGRRVEARVSQREITATVLDTGELAARHTRIFAGFQTIVDPAHQGQLELQRKRRRQRHHIDVEQRPLSVYDALIV